MGFLGSLSWIGVALEARGSGIGTPHLALCPVDAGSAGPPLKAGVAGSDKRVFLVFILLNKNFPPFFSSPHPQSPSSLAIQKGQSREGELLPLWLGLGPRLQLPLVILSNEPLDVGQLAVQVLTAVLLLAVVGVGLQKSSRVSQSCSHWHSGAWLQWELSCVKMLVYLSPQASTAPAFRPVPTGQ